MKKEITLQFSSVEDLWLFWNEFPPNPIKVSLHLKSIIYRLTNEEAELALNKHNAIIVKTGGVQKFK